MDGEEERCWRWGWDERKGEGRGGREGGRGREGEVGRERRGLGYIWFNVHLQSLKDTEAIAFHQAQT